MFERCGDFFEIGGPALFLRHVSASAWDNAFVNFDHTGWFPAPNYVVMKLWRDHYAPHRIAVEGKTGDLNVVATKSEEGKTVCLKMVNPTEAAVTVKANLATGTIGQVSMQLVAPGDINARNTLDLRDAVKPETVPVEKDGQTLRFILPPISCGVVKIGWQ